MRVAIVCRQSLGRSDAIRDHALCLAEALAAAGHPSDVHTRTADGAWEMDGVLRRSLSAGLADYDAVVLQYNPFLYGRQGFAPWLPLEVARIRRLDSKPAIAVAVHEPFVRQGIRLAPVELWQRSQLFALRVCADVVFASIEAWTDELARWRPARPTIHLPSGSTLPDARSERERVRSTLGVGPAQVVLATLSSGHPTHRDDLVAAALERVARRGPTVVLALGSRARPPAVPAGVRLHAPGFLEAHALAAQLAAADVFLAPHDDGVTTRRTGLMAALQHELAVVGTRGRLTDPELAATAAVLLAPVDDPGAFAAAVERVVGDADERRALSAGGRALYEQRYAWSVLARTVAEGLAR